MGFWDGSGISWTICKQSAPGSKQKTTHSVFTSYWKTKLTVQNTALTTHTSTFGHMTGLIVLASGYPKAFQKNHCTLLQQHFIPIKDDTVAENWAKNWSGNRLHSLQSTRVEMASRKIQTYQNKAKNLSTIYFVFDLDGEGKFIKTKHNSDWRNMFLAATLVGRIGGDFVYRKVAAKNRMLMSIFDQFRFSLEVALIAILKTPFGSISFNSSRRCYRVV